MSDSRAYVLISGRVQGVYYRAFTEEVARSLGLRGWVRNRSDGGVEAVFEGPKPDIEKAVARCRQGPPASIVKNIEIVWEDCRDEFESFRVRYF